jgi:hypothetical protein
LADATKFNRKSGARAARRDPSPLWAAFAVRRLHHAIQAFKSIDLLGIAQLGRIE